MKHETCPSFSTGNDRRVNIHFNEESSQIKSIYICFNSKRDKLNKSYFRVAYFNWKNINRSLIGKSGVEKLKKN